MVLVSSFGLGFLLLALRGLTFYQGRIFGGRVAGCMGGYGMYGAYLLETHVS